MGNSLTGLVNSTFSTGRFPTGLLEALITLIPKKDRLELASDFRPITLLNVVFKVITKVLVNKMHPIMSKLIRSFKNSFLPGRSMLDNVILAQEVMHCMNRKKGSKGFMMIKLDLHKAYDSIDWSFLEMVLTNLNVLARFVELIMFLLKESHISVIWNGEKLTPFGVGQGLKQGDPLTPYLFILAMEVLL